MSGLDLQRLPKVVMCPPLFEPAVELPGIAQSQGLTHRLTRMGDVDIFFLCNLQPHACRGDILLDTPHRHP